MTVGGVRRNAFDFAIIEISFLVIRLRLYLVQTPRGDIGDIKLLGCTFTPWSQKGHKGLNQSCTTCGRTRI